MRREEQAGEGKRGREKREMKWRAIRQKGPRRGEKEEDEESRTARKMKMRREGEGVGKKTKIRRKGPGGGDE